jgi:hypothetical protein
MSDEQSKPKLELIDAAASDDPFDLAKLRVSQEFLEATPVKKLLTTVPVRKPGQQDFIRVHPGTKYRDLVAILELKEDRESYLVNLGAVPEVQNECYVATLFTAITRSGVVFLWPVRVPAADGRTNDWHLSAAMAAEQAMKNWVRVRANMSLRAYEIFLAENQKAIPDPEWPALSFQELCRIAFRDRLIDQADHPVIKRLRG